MAKKSAGIAVAGRVEIEEVVPNLKISCLCN